MISKLLERCIFSRLYFEHLLTLEKAQRVFVLGKSYVTQFVEVMDYIAP